MSTDPTLDCQNLTEESQGLVSGCVRAHHQAIAVQSGAVHSVELPAVDHVERHLPFAVRPA